MTKKEKAEVQKLLDVIHEAYRNALDEANRNFGGGPARLSERRQRQLGRNLFHYWGRKSVDDLFKP